MNPSSVSNGVYQSPSVQDSPSSLTVFDVDEMPLNHNKIPMKTFTINGAAVPEAEVTTSRSREPTTWKEALFGFTQNTTMHGIRFIFLNDIFILRRLVWLVLFVSCSVLMSVQIIERIIHYYDYPITVNVHVNFNKTLAFPALTICNQNAFKATSATQHGYYRLIEQLYLQRQAINLTDMELSGVGSLSLADLYLRTAHQKEDLIVSCEWQGQPCSPDNFTQILTDHGVCYNFNDDPNDVRWVTSTGADYGLKLTLNVEQYEYMPGPHDAAGIKILLHDQDEYPKVAELGLALPTGTHTYVGIQLLKLTNLPAPHGRCNSQQSPFYQQYSQESCQLACQTVDLEKKCGCRHFFMPHVKDSPPVCSLKQYINCYRPNITSVKEYVRDHCECPVPCDFLIYDPTISFATTSVYATDRLLADTSTSKLRDKFMRARETTSKMDLLKFNHFVQLEGDMRSKFEELKDVIKSGVRNKLKIQQTALADLNTQMEFIYFTFNRLLRWQLYHVDRNFMRVWNAMEERTLFYLALGFQEYSYQVEARINQMARQPDNTTYPEDVRTAVYLDVMNLLYGRIDLAERAYDNYTQIYDAYFNGTPIFRYKFEDEPRDDNIYITPKPLLKYSLIHNSYAESHSVRLGNYLLSYKDALLVYAELANTSYFNYTADSEKIHFASVRYLNRGRSVHFSKAIFHDEAIEYPAMVLREKIELLDRQWRTFQSEWEDMYGKVSQLLKDLDNLEHTIIRNLDNGLAAADIYIHNGTVDKMSVAEDLTSEEIHNGIITLKMFFADIRSRGQNVYDGWSALVDSTNDIWQSALTDENLEEYYNYKNMTLFLQNVTELSGEIRNNFTTWRDEYDFRFTLGNVDSLFLMNLDLLMKVMKTYIDTSYVDSDFIRKNFLQLDVFYREKSYEQITQQEAYDVFALLCDIGGSMGLFVGASVMTIFELVDLGIHQSLYTLMHRARA